MLPRLTGGDSAGWRTRPARVVGLLALPCWHGWDGRAWTPRPPAAPGRRDLCRGPGGGRRRCDRAPRCPHRPHRPPRPAPLVPAQGAHRGRRDPRGHRRPRGRGGDRDHRRGRRAARHHRLLVRRRRPPRAQDGAPFPAPRDRGRPLRRRHRGDRGRLGAPRRVERQAGLRRRTGTGRARARTAGRHGVSRTALLRAAVAPLLAAALGLAPVGAIASAAPASPAMAPPVLAADPADDVTDDARPVRIEVGRFEPRAITPGATVTVAGTLTNTGSSPITDLAVRLQRGQVISTRDELAAAGRDPDPSAAVLPSFPPLPKDPAPGKKIEFSSSFGADALRLDRDGVYPALLNVNGPIDGDQRRVGELPTFLVQQPVLPTAHTAVGWLWPLAERTHRGPTGDFLDDALTGSVSPDGRLDRALSVIERLPGNPVALAIDPALVEELEQMAAGPYAVHGVDGAGKGTDAAAAFLDRLKAVAAVHPVVALPYGDVDVDSLDAAGLTDVVARSLPAGPDATAEDPLPSSQDDGSTAAPSPAGQTDSAPTGDGGSDGSAGARILADALDVDPRGDLLWAADGTVRTESLATLRSGGIDRLVLSSAGLTDGETAVGLAGSRANAHTPLTPASGAFETLVADPTLSGIVGAAEQTPGGARMAEQRYLAELAVITQQAPAGTEQTVLVAPPRDVEAGPEGAGAMMADTNGLPWLRAAAPDEMFGAAAAPAGELAATGEGTGLDAAGLADIAAAEAVRQDLAGAVVGDADAALRAYDAAIARASSVAWRADAEAFRHSAHAVRVALEKLRGQVTLLAPADGTYSLGSSDAPLVLTVRNDLPITVQVLLEVHTRGSRGLSISDIGLQKLEPGQRTTLQVPTEVRQAGGFGVTAQLTTPSGAPLGDRIELQVKSTAYGSISLLITIGAATLLGLLFLPRLGNFILRPPPAAPSPHQGAPGGAPRAHPSNRSPV